MTQSPPQPLRNRADRRKRTARFGAAERIALGLSIGWLALAGLVFSILPSEDQGGSAATALMTLLAIVLPVALFWIGAAAASASHRMRAENQRLEARLEAALRDRPAGSVADRTEQDAALAEKLDEIARVQKKTEAAVAHLTSINARQSAARRPMEQSAAHGGQGAVVVDLEQPTLALVPPGGTLEPEVSSEDFISALNFPADPSDKAGFRALARALRNTRAKGLIRSSEDVLTLLAEDGLYVDDLTPDRTHPDIWRRFAQGERGLGVAAIGGIRDRDALAQVAGRLREDPVFRDCAHHFLRRFDTMLVAFEPGASDAEIAALAETRTARAFMLIGRVAGTFD